MYAQLTIGFRNQSKICHWMLGSQAFDLPLREAARHVPHAVIHGLVHRPVLVSRHQVALPTVLDHVLGFAVQAPERRVVALVVVVRAVVRPGLRQWKVRPRRRFLQIGNEARELLIGAATPIRSPS